MWAAKLYLIMIKIKRDKVQKVQKRWDWVCEVLEEKECKARIYCTKFSNDILKIRDLLYCCA